MQPVIRYDASSGRLGLLGTPPASHFSIEFDLGWNPLKGSPGVFVTDMPALAAPFYDLCDDEAKRVVYPYALNYHNSFTLGPVASLWGGEGPIAPDLAFLSPEAKTLPFQYGGVQLLQSRRSALLGDPPGAGKTFESISIFNNQNHYPREPAPGRPFVKVARDLRVIVACPAFLVENWAEEIRMWYRAERLPVVALDKPRISIPRAGFFVLPYSRAVAHYETLMSEPGYDGLIMDEVHYLKGDTSVKRAGAFFGSGPIGGGIASRCARAFPLSGTPIPNNPVEIHNLLRAFAPETLGGAWTRDSFEGRYTTPAGWGEKKEPRRKSALNTILRGSGFMVRREKAAILPQLPPKQIALVHMPVHGSIEELIRQEVELFELSKLKSTRTAAELADLVGHIMRVRAAIAKAKAPRIAEYVNYQLDTNEAEKGRLVAFMLHTEAIDIVAEMVERKGTRVFVVDGRVSMKKRHEMKRAFQSAGGPRTLFLGQIKAAGVGLTLTRARRVAMGEVSWSFADNTQAMDRIHRIGQEDDVMVDVLTYPHAVESRVLAAAAQKELDATAILDLRIGAAILEAENALAPDVVDDWSDD